MQRMIFVSLPVTDLEASVAFYAALGFEKNEMLSNDDCAYVVVEENIGLMLHSHAHYAQFVVPERTIAEPKDGAAHLICFSAESREEVEQLTARAVAAGAGPWLPATDYGHMFGASFTDPDGHVLEVMWMDVAAAAEQMSAATA